MSWTSRLSKELEEYGKTILPYELTSNTQYVKNQESVIAEATVDAGKLVWKLTQISAGIKH